MHFTRRDFLKGTVTAASVAYMTGPVFGQETKIRFAQVGFGGRGGAHHGMWRSNKLIAACDANKNAIRNVQDAQKFTDFRDMFEAVGRRIDAVIVATPDHIHYPAAMTALKMGKAAFVEKPLTWGVQESIDLARMVKKKQLPSQMGNQGNAGQGWREIYSIVHTGCIGNVTAVKTWTNRPIWPQGNPRPEGEDPVPGHLDWNAWIGPAPMRPYKGNRTYEPFVWRGWYDFGCGALGDMACHTMNAMFQVMKPEYALTVEPLKVEGVSDDQFPSKQIIKWTFAKSGDCPGFEGYWYDGNLKPEKPEAMGEHKLPGTGSMFVGTKGVLVSASDYNDRPVVYVDGNIIKPEFKMMVEPSDGGFHGEFLKAVKGEKPWDSPMSNFMYAGKITSIINMGTIAQRVNKKITFNPKTMKFDDAKATALMARKPREGWEFPYKI